MMKHNRSTGENLINDMPSLILVIPAKPNGMDLKREKININITSVKIFRVKK